MLPLLHPKKYRLKIEIRNFIGIGHHKIDIKLKRIDDYFYYKPKEYKKKTNEKGVAVFSLIPEGAYLLQISKGKSRIEKIIEFDKNTNLKIRLPLFFGLFSKEKKVDENRIKDVYEKYRIDTYVCFKCHRKYKDWTDKFLCKYCGKYFCSDHKLPEKHNCWGKPEPPPGSGYRIIFSGDKANIIIE